MIHRKFALSGILAVGLLPTVAAGGAWTLPEGRGQAIGASSRTITPLRAWFGGPADRDTASSSLFVEYGAWDDLTVGVTVSGDFTTALDEVEARIGGHVRRRVWTGQAGDVVSVQAGLSLPFERWLGSELGDNVPDSATELDLRVLYGRGWQWDLGNSFVSGELGLRVRGENLDEQIRFDVTAGHEPVRGLLFLTSLFSSFPLGNQDQVSMKLSPSLAYTLWPILGSNQKKPWQPIYPETIQIGVTWDAAQPGSGLEVGLSIWRSF